jgi:hypothetical protein
MTTKTSKISIDLLHEEFEYFEGNLYRKRDSKNNRCKKGDIVNTYELPDGHLRISFYGVQVLIHRVIFAMHYGYWPDKVDHEDHNPKNNLIDNLRETDDQGNSRNTSMKKSNKSGVTGVRLRKMRNGDYKWVANIRNNGKQEHLGVFIEMSDAVKARKDAEVRYGYHKNHGKKQALKK